MRRKRPPPSIRQTGDGRFLSTPRRVRTEVARAPWRLCAGRGPFGPGARTSPRTLRSGLALSPCRTFRLRPTSGTVLPSPCLPRGWARERASCVRGPSPGGVACGVVSRPAAVAGSRGASRIPLCRRGISERRGDEARAVDDADALRQALRGESDVAVEAQVDAELVRVRLPERLRAGRSLEQERVLRAQDQDGVLVRASTEVDGKVRGDGPAGAGSLVHQHHPDHLLAPMAFGRGADEAGGVGAGPRDPERRSSKRLRGGQQG